MINVSQIVDKISKLSPGYSDFKSLGYNDVMIAKELSGYHLTPKYGIKYELKINNLLIDLLTEYDCSNLQIGIINFFKEIIITDEFIIIGEAETDLLTINNVDQSVNIIDYTNNRYVICKCSCNAESFLHAMLHALEFFSNRIKNPRLAYDTEYTGKYIEECTIISGGIQYNDFYSLLMG
jgi:hypothetical protein